MRNPFKRKKRHEITHNERVWLNSEGTIYRVIYKGIIDGHHVFEEINNAQSI